MLNAAVWVLYLGMFYISFLLLLVFLERGELKRDIEYPEEWPSITVIIPAYNEEDTVGMTIESVLDADYPEDLFEVIVVNDGSEDDTRKVAEQYTDRIDLINQENRGKGAAMNTALEEVDTELFAVVDADARLKEDSVKNIVAGLEDDMAGIASAMKVYEPETLLQRAQRVEYIVSIFLRKILGLLDAIPVAPGPLSVYRTDVIREMGGFDPESMVEDQEICYRIHEEKLRLGHSRTGEVYTVAPRNLREFYNQRYRWQRGTLETIIDYRHMFLNPEYGEFGVFGIPSKALQLVLSLMGFSLLLYFVGTPIVNFVRDLASVGAAALDVSLPSSFSALMEAVYWSLLDAKLVSLMLLAFVTFISIFTAYLAAKHTEEKLFEYGKLPPVIYLFFYFYIITPIWIKVMLDIVRKKGMEW
ncbi:MAG: glycosyltransferase family 2 protein [Candidatus Nanohaloarchaea archaeon]